MEAHDLLGEKIDKVSFHTAFQKFDESRKEQPFVYHYTSQDATSRICSTNELLFSNIFNPKDKMEVHFGLEVLHGLLKKSEKYSALCQLIDKKYNRNDPVSMSALNNDVPFYIFCTGDIKDSDYHWREYGDNGKGGCIKFDRIGLFDHLRNDKTVLCYTYPVLYYDENYIADNPKITNFENIMLDYLCLLNNQLGTELKTNASEADKSELENKIFLIILIFASLIKTSCHKDEEEWRFLVLKNQKMEPTEPRQERYSCIDIFECIKNITVGPCAGKRCTGDKKYFAKNPWKKNRC